MAVAEEITTDEQQSAVAAEAPPKKARVSRPRKTAAKPAANGSDEATPVATATPVTDPVVETGSAALLPESPVVEAAQVEVPVDAPPMTQVAEADVSVESGVTAESTDPAVAVEHQWNRTEWCKGSRSASGSPEPATTGPESESETTPPARPAERPGSGLVKWSTAVRQEAARSRPPGAAARRIG